MKKDLKDLTKEEVKEMIKSGMMWEIYPEYTPMQMMYAIADNLSSGNGDYDCSIEMETPE